MKKTILTLAILSLISCEQKMPVEQKLPADLEVIKKEISIRQERILNKDIYHINDFNKSSILENLKKLSADIQKFTITTNQRGFKIDNDRTVKDIGIIVENIEKDRLPRIEAPSHSYSNSEDVSRDAYRKGYRDGQTAYGVSSYDRVSAYEFYLARGYNFSAADVAVYEMGYNDAMYGKPQQY